MPGTVDSLFFDQPAPVLYRWQGGEGNLINSLLWPEDFRDAIAARGPLALQLAALLRDRGPDTAATPSVVYRLYTATIEQAFLALLRAFRNRNGMAWPGTSSCPMSPPSP